MRWHERNTNIAKQVLEKWHERTAALLPLYWTMIVIWLTILTANKRCEAVHRWVFVYMLEFYFAFKTQFGQALVSHVRRNLESSLWKTSWNSRKNISPVMVDERVIKVCCSTLWAQLHRLILNQCRRSDDYSKLWLDVITLSKKVFFFW